MANVRNAPNPYGLKIRGKPPTGVRMTLLGVPSIPDDLKQRLAAFVQARETFLNSAVTTLLHEALQHHGF